MTDEQVTNFEELNKLLKVKNEELNNCVEYINKLRENLNHASKSFEKAEGSIQYLTGIIIALILTHGKNKELRIPHKIALKVDSEIAGAIRTKFEDKDTIVYISEIRNLKNISNEPKIVVQNKEDDDKEIVKQEVDDADL